MDEPASTSAAADAAEEIDRSPPIGVFLSGESFFEAAQHLQRACETSELRLRFNMPVYYLYCHAFELKASPRGSGDTTGGVSRGQRRCFSTSSVISSMI